MNYNILNRAYDQKGDWEEHNSSMYRFFPEPIIDQWGNIIRKEWDGDIE